MSDIYFKNPFRGRKVVSGAAPYVPEHDRLNVEPVEYPIKDKEEFIRMNKKVVMEQKMKEKNKNTKSLLEAFKSGEITEEEFGNIVSDLESKTFVSSGTVLSGQNEDNLWSQAEFLPKTVYDEDIKEKEVLKQEEVPQQEEIIDDLDETTFGFEQVKAGEYILIYRENVINVGNLEEIKETLSNILTDKKLKLDEFIILKRVKAGLGVYIND